MERTLHLKDLAEIEPFSSSFSRLGDNYILTRISSESDKNEVTSKDENCEPVGVNVPTRMNGLLLVMVEKGAVAIKINTDSLELTQGDMFIVTPGTLITFTGVRRPAEFVVLFISTAFLHSINIDLHAIDFRKFISRRHPVLRLDEHEAMIIRKYYDLLELNSRGDDGSMFAKQIARSLIASIVYEFFRFSFDRMGVEECETPVDRPARPMNYVHDFMHLLHLHYISERNMSFYARKLCISPKYLSMITKEATGRTATEWINDFVILEAKNQLRFSGKSIQQVAYALNFSSQSSFGKFFKRVTGQSPSDFQKS